MNTDLKPTAAPTPDELYELYSLADAVEGMLRNLTQLSERLTRKLDDLYWAADEAECEVKYGNGKEAA